VSEQSQKHHLYDFDPVASQEGMASEGTRETYRAYHEGRAANRDDLLNNREVLFQKLAGDAALYRALGRINFVPGQTVLDVAGGSGGSLTPFLELAAPSDTLTSVDMEAANTEAGRERFPGISFHHCDARDMPFPDASFDIVYASTMFCPINNPEIDRAIGKEMRRVVKSGGHIVIRDWNIGDPRKRSFFVPLTRKRMANIFGLPIAFSENGALAPPLGRRLSKYAPWAYFLIHQLFPVGQRVYVLQVASTSVA
jgi:ubiquinone/menaquinone biosynthesis C-methylase UbiE